MNTLDKDEALKLIEDILRDEELNHIGKINAIRDVLPLSELPESVEETPHWPGMWRVARSENYTTLTMDGALRETKSIDLDTTLLRRCMGVLCKTEKEAEFVKAHLEARLEVIDRLEELNGDWRPNWDASDIKHEPQYSRRTDEINICGAQAFATLPDWFQAKAKQIWLRVIEELGEEKVKLALWPTAFQISRQARLGGNTSMERSDASNEEKNLK